MKFPRWLKKSPPLNQTELDYKNKTFEQISSLLEPVIDKNSEEWEILKTRISEEIDEKIQLARNLGTTPQELERQRTEAINSELEKKRIALKNGYSLTEEDQSTIIFPIYEGISFFPAAETVTFSGDKVKNLLLSLSSSDYHTSKEARDSLIGFCDSYAVAEFSKRVRKNYETARRTQEAGYSKIRLISDRKCCEKCQALDGTEIEATELLDEYKQSNLRFPHEIPWEDSVNYCLGPNLLPTET